MITLPREELKRALWAIESAAEILASSKNAESLIETLRARLSAPEPEQTRSEKMREAGITRRPKGWSKEDEPEPVAWIPIEHKYPTTKPLDILMADGSILRGVFPQFDGDLWWEGSGTGEKFINPEYADITHWRIHSYTAPPQPEPEPVADKYLMEIECTKCGAKQDGILTVNTPPQREWQRLTEEEIELDWQFMHDEEGNPPDQCDFARAIEAKLKEKNT